MPGGTSQRHAGQLLLVVLTLAARHHLPSTASAAGVPDPASDFEVLGVAFRNRSLGLDAAFAELGHQCSPKPGGVAVSHFGGPHGRQRGAAARQGGNRAERGRVLSYTPNRQWPVDATASRTALVMAVGSPAQRFTERMQVGHARLSPLRHCRSGGVVSTNVLLSAAHTHGTQTPRLFPTGRNPCQCPLCVPQPAASASMPEAALQ